MEIYIYINLTFSCATFVNYCLAEGRCKRTYCLLQMRSQHTTYWYLDHVPVRPRVYQSLVFAATTEAAGGISDLHVFPLLSD